LTCGCDQTLSLCIFSSFIICTPAVIFFSFFCFLSCYVAHRDLHSFPTRRSSDLSLRLRQRRNLRQGREGDCEDRREGSRWYEGDRLRLHGLRRKRLGEQEAVEEASAGRGRRHLRLTT